MKRVVEFVMNKNVLLNTVKIAGAAVAAILIATALNLEFAVSAGIVAILTIQPTKKETIKTAIGRLGAFIAALLIAWLCFEFIGYTVEAFFVYLVVFILICQCFRWYSAMAMNSVLISHFINFSNMEILAVKNELLIFFIGVGVGIIVNLHLHKNINYIENVMQQTDEQIRNILHRMSVRIVDRDISDYNGKCFHILNDSIRNAKNIADENFNNQFGNSDTFDKDYILMREKQVHVLYDMYKRVRVIRTKPITAQIISDYMEDMARAFHRENTGKELLEEFYGLDSTMKSRPLPITREEFEDRAQLYALLRDIEEFIKIKVDFSEKL